MGRKGRGGGRRGKRGRVKRWKEEVRGRVKGVGVILKGEE